jgi:predicted GNAT family acetyltransferase
MQEIYKNLELVNNTTARQFELNVEGSTAIIEYKQTPSKMFLLHTEVPPQLEGRGVGTAIIEKALQFIEAHHYKLVPLCPFVLAYLQRHPEWKRLVDERAVDE